VNWTELTSYWTFWKRKRKKMKRTKPLSGGNLRARWVKTTAVELWQYPDGTVVVRFNDGHEAVYESLDSFSKRHPEYSAAVAALEPPNIRGKIKTEEYNNSVINDVSFFQLKN
jgi:hypothetical protein